LVQNQSPSKPIEQDQDETRPLVRTNSSLSSAGKEKEASDGSGNEPVLQLAPGDISIDSLRLLELTERLSTVFKASEAEETERKDPLINIFRTFVGLQGLPITSRFSVVSQNAFAQAVKDFVIYRGSDLVVLPWVAGSSSTLTEESSVVNPFETVFGHNAFSSTDRSPLYATFIRGVCQHASCDTAVFLDHGFGQSNMAIGDRQHIFFAFHGGPDDRAALELVVQLCRNPGLSASIVRILRSAEATELDRAWLDSTSGKASAASTSAPQGLTQFTIHGAGAGADTFYGQQTTQLALESDTADNLALSRYFSDSSTAVSSTLSPLTQLALSRITYSIAETIAPLRASVDFAKAAVSASPRSSLLVVVGRGRRGAASHREELTSLLKDHVKNSGGSVSSLGMIASTEVRKTLGDAASAYVVAGVGRGLLLLQAASSSAAGSDEV